MKHTELMIFEGVMCCSTGICGPEPDKTLIEFNDTLKRLQEDYPELNIQRANMSFNLDVFRTNKDILQLVKERGVEILPVIRIDGLVVSRQKYMTYEELKKVLED